MRSVALFAIAATFAVACGSAATTPADATPDAVADVTGDTRADAAPDAAHPPPGDAGGDPPLHALADPRIGTGGRGWWAGNAFVGASAPFGLVSVGPDGTAVGNAFPWEHCSGYHALDDTVMAFSHTHLHGTGIPDLGAIGFMPFVGEMTEERLRPGYWSGFANGTDEARPGSYAVTLADNGVRVELTATELAAHHRYTPTDPAADTLTLLVDVRHVLAPGQARDGGIEVHPTPSSQTSLDLPEIRAWAEFTSGFSTTFGSVRQYVVARVVAPATGHGTWKGGALHPGVGAQDGAATGGWLTVAVPHGAPVEVRVGVSYVDFRGALRNLEEGGLGGRFDETRAAAESAWADALSAVRCEGGSVEDRTILATSLYHAFLMPTRFSDVDGRYLGFDGVVHTAADFRFHTNFSLWDTYRTLHPLLVWLAPERQSEMVRSLLRIHEEGGWLPKWPLANGYTNIMIGTFADVVVAESYLKGVPDIDPAAAWEAVDKVASVPVPADHVYVGREGLADYLALGYVPADRVGQSVSRTLEWAVADAAIANLADALGRDADAARYRARAQSYRNVWEPESGYFRPRNADGSWVAEFDPLSTEVLGARAFTEGTAEQYLWLAPHDPAGLVALHGGADAFVARLEDFFARGAAENEAIFAEDHTPLWWMTSPPHWYWHGNEPDIHAAWLFAEAGRPDLTADWVRWIQDTLHHTGRDGVPGNDDAGTLGAWYVFAALGVYPVAGSDRYVLGAPRFPRCEVAVGDATLVVEREGDGPYVQGVTLDGAPVDTPALRHADIADGATLRFEMGASPSAWGRRR